MNATGRPTVLVIDNDSTTRQAIFEALHGLKVTVIETTTAAEGAQVLKSGTLPNIVLIGLDLPDVDGVEFTSQMRAHTLFEPVSVVVMVDDIHPQRIREALQVGADRYITKQYLQHNLPRVIQEVLSTARRKAS